TSSRNNWTYVTVVPKKVVLSQVNYVEAWALGSTIFFIIIGILSSYILATSNYRPIREVVETILSGKSHGKAKVSNEMEFIKQTIKHTWEEQDQLQRIVSQQAPVIKSDFISRL